MKQWFLIPCCALIYGAAPVTAQEQDSEIVSVGSDKFLRWYGHEGRTYFLQAADPNDPLNKWLWAPIIETGNNEDISYEVDGTANKAFFRLKYTDQHSDDPEAADFDEDGLGNWVEISLHQTDPLNPDTDGDGLPDSWEIAHGISPLDDGSVNIVNGAAGQFQNSGLTNAEAYALGVLAHSSATIGDHDGDGLENHEDADPKQLLIDWKRAPQVTYAIIDLNMEPLDSFFPPHSRYPVSAVLNDHGEICREPLADLTERNPFFWDGMNYPVAWQLLQDYIDVNDNETDFSSEWQVSFNNDGNVFHGLSLDNAFNGIPGIQNITVLWNDANSAPALYGDHPLEVPISRLVESRFDHKAIQLTLSNYPEIDQHDRTITVGNFIVSDSAEEFEDLPTLSTFNFYSHAPDITRTGKILIYQDEAYKVNEVPAPAGDIYGLCADPLDHDLIGVLSSATPPSISSLRYRNNAWETMPMPGIMDMNEAGTAITFPEHQVWVNAETIILDELLENCGWSQFKAEQINKNGLILGSAMPDEGTAHKAVLLVPLNFDVYPPEPTDDEIAAAGDDNWEVETFQIPADDPQFWVQANIMVPGKDDDGKPIMVPAEDGTEVTWEIDSDVSDYGASLSSSTTITENGHTAVLLTTSTIPRDRFKITAKLTKLKWKTGVDHEVATYEDEDGFHTIKTQFFEVVPGNVSSIVVTAPESSMPADEASEIVLNAVLTDEEGNPAARGTDVTWHVSGGGKIKQRDHLISEENGTVSATLVSGSVVGSQKITVEADGVVGEITITNSPCQVVSLTPSANSLDIASGQTATISLQTSGLADGAEVTWKTSLGTILQKSATIQNNAAQAVLRADAGVIGNSVVWATVGDSITHCNVTFTSSAIASIEVEQPVLVYDESTDGIGTVPTLAGGTENISYFANSNVTIRSPGNPGAWATVSFTGTSGISGFTFPFDEENNQLSPSSPAVTNATLANGAEIVSDQDQSRVGMGTLSLPTVSATATIPHDNSLSLEPGSRMRFSLRPTETFGSIIAKQAEYSAAVMEDGRLKFTLGTGQNATEVISAAPLTLEKWHDVSIVLDSGYLMMEIGGSLTSSQLLSMPSTNTNDVVIGGCIGHIEDLRYLHQQAGLQGISIIAATLNGQNQVQLDGNGEAVIQVHPQILGQGPPPEVLGQTVNVQVQVANQSVTAKNALTVTDKGTAILIKAIGGQTSYIGQSVTSETDRAKLVNEQMRAAISVADRTGALPKDMGADAVARGEAGYLIAIWMEETVDETGIVHHIMSVSAQNLPENIAQVLNWMLAEMMVSAGQRDKSQSFRDYIWKNHQELILALQALSAGDEVGFLALAGVVDGVEGFENATATSSQMGEGIAARIAKTAASELNNKFELMRNAFNRRSSRLKIASISEGFGNFDQAVRGPILAALQSGEVGIEAVLRDLSQKLYEDGSIDEKTVAAIGAIYGFLKEGNAIAQEAAHPELFAKAIPNLLDILLGAARKDAASIDALKDIGAGIIMAPVNEIPQAEEAWAQQQYFNAGRHQAAAAIGGVLIANEFKRSLQRGAYRCVGHGRHLKTLVGMRGEALALARFRAKGYTDIVPIQNGSNHGIDLIMRDKNGGIVAVEVKGHLLMQTPRKIPNMEEFVTTRLADAKTPDGYWKNVDQKTRENAVKFFDEITKQKKPVRGIVMNVNYALMQYPRERYYEWDKGLGAEIFDNDF